MMVPPYLEFSNGLVSQITSSIIVPKWAIALFVVLVIWSLVWKLLGLWKSARKGSVVWFIILAVTNTLGILPILYIYVFSEMGKKTRALVRTVRRSTRKKRR